MFKNYLKITFRNLLKHKSYTLINVFGLSIGIACCLLIILYVQYELSFDKYHENAQRIHRIVMNWSSGNDIIHSAISPYRLADALKADFPEIENIVRFDHQEVYVKYNNSSMRESSVFICDESVFDVFSFELSEGDPGTALKDPFTVVLTENTAKKYFND